MLYTVTKANNLFNVGDTVEVVKKIGKRIWTVKRLNGVVATGNVLSDNLTVLNAQQAVAQPVAQPAVQPAAQPAAVQQVQPAVQQVQPAVQQVQPAVQQVQPAMPQVQPVVPQVQPAMQPVAQPVVQPPLRPPFNRVINPGRHWLTFETRCNADRFQKTDQQKSVGLHLLPLGFVEVNAVADLPVELIDAHFPGYTRAEILAYAHLCRNYDDGGDPDNPQPGPPAPDILNQNGSRAVLTINAPGYVVMPFNVADNDSQTNSLGRTRIDADAWKLAETWPSWKTASRSCIVRPAPVDIDDSQDNFDWVFGHQPADRHDSVNAGNREGAAGGATAFDLARDHARAYSYKCGVTYIGKACQPSKDRLDQESIIGRLRTDYIDAMNQRLRPQNQLVLMRELLTVIGARWKKGVMQPDDHDNFDGFVVRDLSALRHDHVYLATLSIPYGGAEIVDEYNYNVQPNVALTYETFWQRHYAEALGRTKAKLLLHYGLQCLTPNPQNFLVEMTARMEPTGRLFLRDIGDLNLHHPVVFALNSAVATNADPTQLQNATLRFEYANPYHYHTLPEDTANGKESVVGRYPPNTQFHWAQYSLFKPWGVPETRQEKKRNATWGRAHNAAYMAYLNQSLNENFNIDTLNTAGDLLNNVVGPLQSLRVGQQAALHAFVTLRGGFPLDAYDDPNNSDADLEKLERLLEIRQVTWLHTQLASPAILTKIANYHATLC